PRPEPSADDRRGLREELLPAPRGAEPARRAGGLLLLPLLRPRSLRLGALRPALVLRARLPAGSGAQPGGARGAAGDEARGDYGARLPNWRGRAARRGGAAGRPADRAGDGGGGGGWAGAVA